MIDIHGIPAHPLVVHAAVVLVPAAALCSAAYAVWPRRRWQTRTPAVVLPLAAATALVLVVLTGDAGARAVWGTSGQSAGSTMPVKGGGTAL